METLADKKVSPLIGEVSETNQTFPVLMPDKTLYLVNFFLLHQEHKEDPLRQC